MNCPACRNEMDQLKFRETEIEQCTRCRGIWLDHEEIDQIFSMANLPGRLVNQEMYRDPPDLIPEGERHCPRCTELFKVIQVDGITLDACSSCKGVFCDIGELKELALAAEMRYQREQAQRAGS